MVESFWYVLGCLSVDFMLEEKEGIIQSELEQPFVLELRLDRTDTQLLQPFSFR